MPADWPAAAFLGAICDSDGNPLDVLRPRLAQADLDAYPNREVAPITRMWLLADDVTPAAVPPCIMSEAVQFVLAGRGIVILARRPEAEVDVRTRLLHALDLFQAAPEEGGRA